MKTNVRCAVPSTQDAGSGWSGDEALRDAFGRIFSFQEFTREDLFVTSRKPCKDIVTHIYSSVKF